MGACEAGERAGILAGSWEFSELEYASSLLHHGDVTDCTMIFHFFVISCRSKWSVFPMVVMAGYAENKNGAGKWGVFNDTAET